MTNNDLTGKWVDVGSSRPYLSGTIGQVLAHDVTEEGYYVSSDHWGLRFRREQFDVIEAPEYPSPLAYPDWHVMVGGDGVVPEGYHGHWEEGYEWH